MHPQSGGKLLMTENEECVIVKYILVSFFDLRCEDVTYVFRLYHTIVFCPTHVSGSCVCMYVCMCLCHYVCLSLCVYVCVNNDIYVMYTSLCFCVYCTY